MKDLILDYHYTKVLILLLSPLALVYFDAELFAYSLLWGWILSGLVTSIFLHKHLSHKQFEFKHPMIKRFFYLLFFMSGSATPVGWAGGHRDHHAKSDTEEDPYIGPWYSILFGFLNLRDVSPMKMRDLLFDKEIMFVHKYTRHGFTAYVILLALIDPLYAIYFGGISPLIAILYLGVVNLWGHNYKLKQEETAVNFLHNPIMTLMFWGENDHRVHHDKPRLCKLNKYDLGYYVIKLIGKKYAVR